VCLSVCACVCVLTQDRDGVCVCVCECVLTQARDGVCVSVY